MSRQSCFRIASTNQASERSGGLRQPTAQIGCLRRYQPFSAEEVSLVPVLTCAEVP